VLDREGARDGKFFRFMTRGCRGISGFRVDRGISPMGNAMATQASRFSPGARRIAGGRCYNRAVINRFALGQDRGNSGFSHGILRE